MVRFSGHLSVHAVPRDGRTVLAAQAFRAPYHISKPYWDSEARTLLLQVVNPTAGILCGDELESRVAVESGGSLLLTTPSASRIFAMRGGLAESRLSYTIAAGGWLEVSPEALVPHRGSSFRQFTTVHAALGSGLFLVETLMPGRIAHGDAWSWERLQLATDVWHGSRRVLSERFDYSGPELKTLARFAGAGETACLANAVLIPPRPLAPATVRAIADLHDGPLWTGMSPLSHDGGYTIRLIGSDPMILRRGLSAVRERLQTEIAPLACRSRKL